MTRAAAAAAAAGLVLAGCGGGTHTPAPARKLPHALAQTWAQRADAIATQLAAGNGCDAQQLAQSLRDDVIGAEARLPVRYRATLLAAVNDLANRITCTPPTRTVTVPQPGPPGHKKPKPPDHHGHGKHDK